MHYDLEKHNFEDPSPWTALALDHSTFFEPVAREALMRNNATRSRQFFLPVIRPFAKLLIILVQLIRIVLPNSLTSSRMLHGLIVWGMKNFVHPDANYLIIRHFNIGSQILKFIADNVPEVEIKSHPLHPKTIADLGNNTFVQHDLNIFNFIIQVGAQLTAKGKKIEPVPLEKVDFSAIQDCHAQIETLPRRWTNVLDLQSAIEMYTPMFAIFLSDKDFWRASHSLQLDETIAIYVAQIFKTPEILGLVNNKHPMVPISTLESGYRLMLHGLDAENLYGYIKFMKEKQTLEKQAA